MTNDANGRYRLLVTLLTICVGLLSGLGAIAASLVIGRIDRIEQRLDDISSQQILPLAEDRIRELDRRISQLEDDLRDHERQDH